MLLSEPQLALTCRVVLLRVVPASRVAVVGLVMIVVVVVVARLRL
jgi:hypothetical protein